MNKRTLTRKSLAIASMLFPSLNSNLDGISIDLFLYGCNRHCRNCHNPELQEFKKPTYSISELLEILEKQMKYNPYVLTLLGGEPLDNDIKDLVNLITAVKNKFPSIKVAMYTGYEFEDVPKELIFILDYIKTGEYNDLEPTTFGSFLATRNQIMFKKDGKVFTQQYPNI